MQCYPLQGNIPLQAVAAPAAEPADNTAAVVTITCTSTQIVVIDCIVASYDSVSAAGKITSTGLRTQQLAIHYNTTAENLRPFVLAPPGGLYGSTDGTSVVITLAAGGGTCQGTLYVLYHVAQKAAND